MGGLSIRTAWAWLRLLIGAAIVGALVWKVGGGGFLDGIRVIHVGELAAALGIGLVTTVLCAWRWCLVARRVGLRLPLGRAVADYYRAMFLNSVLPAGVLGDVHRAVRHGKDEGDVGAGVRAVVLERTAGQAVVIAAGVVVLLATPIGSARDIGLVVLAVAVAVVAGYLAGRRWARPGSRWHRTLEDIRHGLLARDAWPGIALLSAAALAGHITLFVVAARAAGATLPAGKLVPIAIVALLAMGLPVNIGGWGPREGATALMFAAAGVGAAQGLTAAVAYGLLGLVASLPGALVLLRRERETNHDGSGRHRAAGGGRADGRHPLAHGLRGLPRGRVPRPAGPRARRAGLRRRHGAQPAHPGALGVSDRRRLRVDPVRVR